MSSYHTLRLLFSNISISGLLRPVLFTSRARPSPSTLGPAEPDFGLSGRLWLVDWGLSGFYRAFMEYFGMPEEALL